MGTDTATIDGEQIAELLGRFVNDLGATRQHGKRITVEAPAGYLEDVGLGDSIALNGACMTVTGLDA